MNTAFHTTIHTEILGLKEKLQEIYDFSESEIISSWVFEHLFNCSKAELMSRKMEGFPENKQLRLAEIQEQLLQHRPIQYVLKESYFYGLRLNVDESVLIPRPETEELVDWILKDHPSLEENFKVIDIGTGSGCIAIALKKNRKNWEVSGIDISLSALSKARENSEIHDLNIDFGHIDILQTEDWTFLKKFDLIISNPPYILKKEQSEIDMHVVDYEPHDALFVKNEDPLQFYKKIEEFARLHLSANGFIYVELHSTFAHLVEGYFKNNNWDTMIKLDLQERKRMLKAWKP